MRKIAFHILNKLDMISILMFYYDEVIDMIRGIKTLFSAELKNLNKAFDDIIKMKKIDGMKDKISKLGKALKAFAKLKVTQKAGKGAESQWVNKNETEDVYANICSIKQESVLLEDELCWDIDVMRLHQWYHLSPTISTFPWHRCKLAAATILKAYLITKTASDRWMEKVIMVEDGKESKYNGVDVETLIKKLEKERWGNIQGQCVKLVKKKKLDFSGKEIKRLRDSLRSEII